MTKSELRQIYLNKRKSLSANEIDAASGHIADLFFGNFDLKKVGTLHCFIPIIKFNEINTSFILERVWREYIGIKTVAPLTDLDSGDIESVVFRDNTELRQNAWGIAEPVSGDTTDAVEIDIVLVPLLCFDRTGHRVGYGKGLYDRFLAKCRPDCQKIGLSYFPPVEKSIDVVEHDVPLDFCVTPKKIFTVENGYDLSNKKHRLREKR